MRAPPLDTAGSRPHAFRVAAARRDSAKLIAGLLGVLATATLARADAIQKWRTPSVSLYFGDRAPAGSVLLETIADTPARAPAPETAVANDLARAAADGREIIRRRSADRAEERRLEAEREARLDALGADVEEAALPFVIIDTFPRCRFGEPCFGPGFDRFAPARLERGHRRHRAPFPFLRPALAPRARAWRSPASSASRFLGSGRSRRPSGR